MDLDAKKIGRRIAQKRKDKDFSQEQLSEILGISKNHLSGIERGLYVSTTKTIFEICNILGESPDYYLIGKIAPEANEIIDIIKQFPPSSHSFLLNMQKLLLEEFELIDTGSKK